MHVRWRSSRKVGISRKVRAQDERVGEEPDQVFKLRLRPIGDRRAHQQVLQAGVAVQQDIERRQKRHEKGDSGLLRQSRQGADQLAGQVEIHTGAAVGPGRRPRPVAGQLQLQRRAVELLLPVGQVAREHAPRAKRLAASRRNRRTGSAVPATPAPRPGGGPNRARTIRGGESPRRIRRRRCDASRARARAPRGRAAPATSAASGRGRDRRDGRTPPAAPAPVRSRARPPAGRSGPECFSATPRSGTITCAGAPSTSGRSCATPRDAGRGRRATHGEHPRRGLRAAERRSEHCTRRFPAATAPGTTAGAACGRAGTSRAGARRGIRRASPEARLFSSSCRSSQRALVGGKVRDALSQVAHRGFPIQIPIRRTLAQIRYSGRSN